MRIAVNAGHCPGKDPGALGTYSNEAEITKQIAEALCLMIDRTEDESLFIQLNDLDDICYEANYFDADIFISIHCNAYDGEARGTETYFYYGSEKSEKLAEIVQDELVDVLRTTDRGIKDGSMFYVIRNTEMPAILIELAFIDNPEEEKLLNNNIDKIAAAIYSAILRYKQVSNY